MGGRNVKIAHGQFIIVGSPRDFSSYSDRKFNIRRK